MAVLRILTVLLAALATTLSARAIETDQFYAWGRELPEGRFDAIAVTGSIQAFDPRFVEALDEQGRLFVVVGDAPAMEAKLIERTNEHDWTTIALFETDLKPLVHGALPPRFSF